ncbi:MAG TPA: type I phosphomannose isomerase catalytic subunit [Candidatus Acidoferrales bacterium]|nr:type I phosphomannose isomerase catalytic subunit [Candidatus Acidoferrales bacterium]
MSAPPVPWRLAPRFVERIWGLKRLGPLFPGVEAAGEPIGEAWLTAEDCPLATGPYAGRTLGEAWREMPRESRGANAGGEAGFPLLVKFLFPAQKLSLQVHPDDAYAARHERGPGARGKTEMWHVVAATPGAEVRVGLEAGVDPATLEASLASGAIEHCMRRIPVRSGDTIFVPAGTIHTIGPGPILCEIQEYSDLTYRLFDYNRVGADGKPRALHVENALGALRFGASPAGRTRPLVRREGPLALSYLAGCRYFAAERWEFDRPVDPATGAAHFDLLIFLAGAGRLKAGSGAQDYRRGETWFLPADLGGYRLEPGEATVLLRAYVPDLDSLENCLLAGGFSPQEVAGVVFR